MAVTVFPVPGQGDRTSEDGGSSEAPISRLMSPRPSAKAISVVEPPSRTLMPKARTLPGLVGIRDMVDLRVADRGAAQEE